MRRIYDPREIRRLFSEGVNVIAALKVKGDQTHTSPSMILYSYDAQAGGYVRALEDPKYRALREAHSAAIASIIAGLPGAPFDGILEAGVGEATTLGLVLEKLPNVSTAFGFDISLSRLLSAKRFLVVRALTKQPTLFTAELEAVPLPDDSVDLVYTSYALEPNGGREGPILAELLRVSRRYLVLIEPGYELADAEGRAHMERHGYVRGLADELRKLGAKILEYETWSHTHNPRNPTQLLVAEKKPGTPNVPRLVSPIGHTPLEARDTVLYAPAEGFAFPVIAGIPCLVPDNAVLVTKLDEFCR